MNKPGFDRLSHGITTTDTELVEVSEFQKVTIPVTELAEVNKLH